MNLVDEPLQGFSAEDVTCPSAHITLFDDRLVLATKVNGVRSVERLQQVLQVLDNHVRVVVSLLRKVF